MARGQQQIGGDQRGGAQPVLVAAELGDHEEYIRIRTIGLPAADPELLVRRIRFRILRRASERQYRRSQDEPHPR